MLYMTIWIAFFIILSLYDKTDVWLFRVSLILLTIMFAFTYNNADYDNYLIEYIRSEKMDWRDSEPVWILLMHIFSKLQLPFSVFRAAIFMCAIALINSTISKICNQINFLLLLYFIYPFIIDVTQIRNFFAMSILVFALKYLAAKSRTSIIKFILCIIIATMIHNIFIVYLILIPVKLFSFRKAVLIFIVAFTVMIVLFNRLPYLVLSFFGNYHQGSAHVEKYVVKSLVSPTMIIALGLFYIVFVLGAFWANNQYINAVKHNKCSEEMFGEIQFYLKCIVLISLSFFLNVYSMDFSRVFRNIIIIDYAVVLSAISYSPKRFRHLFYSLLIVIVLYSGLLFEFYPYAETVVYPLFNNNYIFDFISIH